MPRPLSAFLEAKHAGRPLTFLTCYDVTFARIMDDALLDGLLVGDSLAEVIYGLSSTKDIGFDVMYRHTKAVVRGATKTHVMADMPWGTYDSTRKAVHYAKKMLSVGAGSVKMENPSSLVAKALAKEGIPLCGHVGLTPQTIFPYKKQGVSQASRSAIIDDAHRLADDGCFLLIIEAVPDDLAREITQALSIPTVGIAAGPDCDGQILVHYDMLGLTPQRPYARQHASFSEALLEAIGRYKAHTAAYGKSRL